VVMTHLTSMTPSTLASSASRVYVGSTLERRTGRVIPSPNGRTVGAADVVATAAEVDPLYGLDPPRDPFDVPPGATPGTAPGAPVESAGAPEGAAIVVGMVDGAIAAGSIERGVAIATGSGVGSDGRLVFAGAVFFRAAEA